MKSTISREGCYLVHHCPEIEDIDIIGAADHVIVAKFQHDLWRGSASSSFREERGQIAPHPLRAELRVGPPASGPFRRLDGQ